MLYRTFTTPVNKINIVLEHFQYSRMGPEGVKGQRSQGSRVRGVRGQGSEETPQQEDAQKPGSLCKEKWEERDCALTKHLTTSVSTGRHPF